MKIFVMCLLMMGALVGGRPAAAVTLDFETLVDSELVTTEFAGLTFANTIALASGEVGGTLNEIESPAHSGVTVVSDDLGAITITFDTPVAAASGFFNYGVPVTITAFDALLVSVATATSTFGSNLVLSGDPGSVPNELLQAAFAGGISSLTLQGDAGGGSFTLDDFTFVPVVVSPPPVPAAETPVPGPLVLVTAALIAVAGWRRRGRRSTRRRFPNAC